MRKAVSMCLLAALLLGPAGCVYHPGVELPIPRSAGDTAAIAAVMAAKYAYVRPIPIQLANRHDAARSGSILGFLSSSADPAIEILRVEYPRIMGGYTGQAVDLRLDSISSIRARELDTVRTGLLVTTVAAGLVLLARVIQGLIEFKSSDLGWT